MWARGLKIHRVTSWLITLLAFITIFFGYAATKKWFPDYAFFLFLHLVTGWIFPFTLIVHFVFSIMYLNFKWSRIRAAFKRGNPSSITTLRMFQKITKWGIIVMALIISFTGLSYYPPVNIPFTINFLPFTIHLDFDIILSIFMIIHVAIGARFYFTRHKINHWSANLSLIFLALSLLLTVFFVDLPPGMKPSGISISGKFYDFEPNDVESVRPDLFQNESFSAFDVLVQLNATGDIDLNYHFNSSMDTYVIDSINGNSDNWWYHLYYSGGSIENNEVRMDHYPWKPGTRIVMYHESESYMSATFSLFTDEVSRYAFYNNSIIIPRVNVSGYSFSEEFNNITVTPHNLRNETFRNDVITAMDVIMTLGDLGLITYELTYHVSFRSASYVHSYFVSKINTDEAVGRCGYLYDVSESFIWLSADERIITSPESIDFYWGCI